MPDISHPETLLGQTFPCRCGKTHTISLQTIIYDEAAIDAIPDVLSKQVRGRSLALFADVRTWVIAGEITAAVLRRTGWSVKSFVLSDTEHGSPVCDDLTFEKLNAELPAVDTLVAVGSGVINDLTKWLAFERHLPYAVLATAATMNGYAAANVAPALKGVKSILFAQSPVAVLAVPSLIAAAPFELTAAGLGDVIAKPISTADWIMNHQLFDEYFCRDTTDMISGLELGYVDHPEAVKVSQPAAIEALFKALLYSGVAMTMVGTSAPASGGEHMFSHTLDMMSTVDQIPHDLHGRQVGLGTILAAALYDRLLQIDQPCITPLPVDIDQVFWGQLADATAEQYALKQPLLKIMYEKLSHADNWLALLAAIRNQIRSPRQIKDCLCRAGAAHGFGDIHCSRDRIRRAVVHMHEIRKRPTVVDLAWAMGILPGAADELIDQWLT